MHDTKTIKMADSVADILFNNISTREKLIKSFDIKNHLGIVVLNGMEVNEFINFFINCSEEEGINWEPDSPKQEKIEFAKLVVASFVQKVINQNNNYLPAFSNN